MGFDDIDRKYRPKLPIKLECLRCGHTDGVELENSRTCYVFDGSPDDPDNPNRPIPLCRLCAKEHHDEWDQIWREYHLGALYG